MYKITCKNKVTGVTGEGEPHNNRDMLVGIAAKMDKEYPEISHQVVPVEAMSMEEQDRAIKEMEEKFGGKWEELCLDLVNVPSAQALDELWKAVILSNKPDYGDWEYPGQAFRHLLAEWNELKAERNSLLSASETLWSELRGQLARISLVAGIGGPCVLRFLDKGGIVCANTDEAIAKADEFMAEEFSDVYAAIAAAKEKQDDNNTIE